MRPNRFVVSTAALCLGAISARAGTFSDGSVFFEDFTDPADALNYFTWQDIDPNPAASLTVSGGLMSISTPSAGDDRSIIVRPEKAFDLGTIAQPAYEAKFKVATGDDLDNIDGGTGPGNRNARVFIGNDSAFNNLDDANKFDIVSSTNLNGTVLASGLNREQFYTTTVVYDPGIFKYQCYLDGNLIGNVDTLDGTVGQPTRIYTGDTNGGTQYQGFAVDYFKVGNILSDQTGWLIDGSGDWNIATNWNFGTIPNGVGALAVFGSAITSAQTVYTNIPVTVGTLRFNNANRYNITGNGSLAIETSSGSGLIDVQAGSQKINLPLFFNSDSNVTVAGGAELLISNPVTIRANKTVTKTGAVTIEAPLILESGAVLALASGPTTAFGAPSLASGAKIDVKTNSMTVDYRGQVSPAATIKAQLASGYASGAWNGEGINTSSAVAHQTALGWKDDAASSSILVKYTYYGDANLDGQVDISDLGALATAWQTSAVWSQGDFDYSGFVDISDLGKLATNWQLGVGSPLGPSFDEALASVGLAGVSVPEPAGLSIIGLVALAFRRRRR